MWNYCGPSRGQQLATLKRMVTLLKRTVTVLDKDNEEGESVFEGTGINVGF